MANQNTLKNRANLVTHIVSEAGGEIIGRTKLQKLAYLLELSGHGYGIPFEYKHYGPYSEQLAEATQAATLFGLMTERKQSTNWGGFYSIFSTEVQSKSSWSNPTRQQIAAAAVEANAVELELAATAAFLADDGCKDPWEETARRKPEKCANGRLDRAKILYSSLKSIPGTESLPDIV